MTATYTTRTADKKNACNVEMMLRDMAYVLKLTRQVKEEMLKDSPNRETKRAAERVPSAARELALA